VSVLSRAPIRTVRREKPCKVCEHAERVRIDKALVVIGQSPNSLSRRYSNLTRRALTRHRDVCLRDAVVVD
jgi:hypothetical protein